MSARTLGQVVILLAAALLGAVVSNALAGPERKLRWLGSSPAASGPVRPSGPSPSAAAPAPAAAPQAKTFAPHPQAPWVEISSEDALALFSRKDVLFLDARRTSVYREGHIAGARPFSVWESDVDEKVKRFYEEGHEPSAPIVVYCSGGECEDSHMLAQKFYMAGFDNVLVYKDGFPDWEKRGLPVTKGEKP